MSDLAPFVEFVVLACCIFFVALVIIISLLAAVLHRLEAIKQKQGILSWRIQNMAVSLDDVVAKVTEVKTVEDSAITLLTQLSTLLKNAGNDPVKIQAVIASLDANKQALADAIVANTPAEPVP